MAKNGRQLMQMWANNRKQIENIQQLCLVRIWLKRNHIQPDRMRFFFCVSLICMFRIARWSIWRFFFPCRSCHLKAVHLTEFVQIVHSHELFIWTGNGMEMWSPPQISRQFQALGILHSTNSRTAKHRNANLRPISILRTLAIRILCEIKRCVNLKSFSVITITKYNERMRAPTMFSVKQFICQFPTMIFLLICFHES